LPKHLICRLSDGYQMRKLVSVSEKEVNGLKNRVKLQIAAYSSIIIKVKVERTLLIILIR
jgi:hypothetical protein